MKLSEQDIRHIMSHAREDGECWLWKRGVPSTLDLPSGKHVRVLRAVYEYYKGPIEGRLCVSHACHNPRCINPTHLGLKWTSKAIYWEVLP